MLLCGVMANANNITVQKVSLADTNRTARTVNIKFNLSWENSWRDEINWDAAWVFVKFKQKGGTWHHLKLHLTGNAIGSSSVPMHIKVPADSMGAFIYRQNNGDGKNELTDVTVFWDYGASNITDIDSVETRVYATEMVYVPEGSFAVGDGNATTFNRLRSKKNESDYVVISDSMSVPIFRKIYEEMMGNFGTASPTVWIDGKRGLSIDGVTIKNAGFPTGYKAFYCMKYEVSQGQYADMLNAIGWSTSLDEPGVTNKVETFFPPLGSPNRFSITLQDTVYVAAYPNRACNYLGYRGYAFADWAGLRAMTEFEFEKAARGPLAPVKGEGAGGVAVTQDYTRMAIVGEENGTETISPQEALYNVNLNYADNSWGPYRVGAFAAATSTRISSGASYYGIMDMNSNLRENVLIYEVNQDVKGLHGDGYLPGYESAAMRYQDIDSYDSLESIACQKGITISGITSGNDNLAGFRAVRTAPEEN